MADLDLTDNGKTYTDAGGIVWDQQVCRRLSSGEYMRVMLERYGRRLLLQFGHVDPGDPNTHHWTFEVPLTMQDAICVLGEISFGQLNAVKNTDAYIQQVAHANLDLERKVVGLAQELKSLKDAPQEGLDAQGV
jgi:hypothetical protein